MVLVLIILFSGLLLYSCAGGVIITNRRMPLGHFWWYWLCRYR